MSFEETNPPYKSILLISNNFRVMSLKHYNWFQKLMWKFLLNIEIIDIKENNI